jgi:hypothetical protein
MSGTRMPSLGLTGADIFPSLLDGLGLLDLPAGAALLLVLPMPLLLPATAVLPAWALQCAARASRALLMRGQVDSTSCDCCCRRDDR